MKVTIIGGPGSGKSTMAKKISDKLQIPYLQIDRLWFESGGNNLRENDAQEKERVRSFVREKVTEFIKQDTWVSDGWYSKVQPLIAEEADVIIFLDIPLLKRLWNHLKRICKNERHKELTKKDDFLFFLEIILRQFSKMPGLRKFVTENRDKVKIFKNHKEINDYISGL